MSPDFTKTWLKALVEGQSPAADWYAGRPADASARAEARRRDRPCPLSQAEIDDWKSFLAPFDPPKPVLKNIDRLGDARTVVVVTGQQTGLAGGPLLTLLKALGAVRWAKRLEAEGAGPAVPVFWAASDDHDFAEVSEAAWFNASGELSQFQIEQPPAGPGRPVFEQPFTPEAAEALIAEMANGADGDDALEPLFEALRQEAARPGASWESQFLGLLIRATGSLGLVPVVPRMGWLRRRATPLVQAELRGDAASTELLLEAGRRLEAEGAAGKTLHRAPDDVNFFLHRDGVRWKLRRDGDRIEVLHPDTGGDGGSMTAAEMAELAGREPESFSPNAALRRLVQDLALPTALFLGGPSEVIYHAQLKSLYEAFDVFRPIVGPRPFGALVSTRVRRAAEALGFDAQTALAAGEGGVRDAALQVAGSTGLLPKVDDGIRQLRSIMDQIEDDVSGETNDTYVRIAAERMAGRLEGRIEALEARVRDYVLRRQPETARHAERVTGAFWPSGVPQERQVNWAAFAPGLLGGVGANEIADALDLDSLEPRAILRDQIPQKIG